MSRRREPGALQKGHSGRLLALEPASRAACRGIDNQAGSPRRLLEQPTEGAHRFHLTCDGDTILRNESAAAPDDPRNIENESPASLAANAESEGRWSPITRDAKAHQSTSACHNY